MMQMFRIMGFVCHKARLTAITERCTLTMSVYPVPTVRPSFNVWPLPLGQASYIIIDWFMSGWAMPAHHVLS